MSKRHGATISLFLFIGGIFFIGPVIGVLISGIGAAWGIWGNETKQAEGNSIQLTELYHLVDSPEGPRLTIKKGILPERNLGRPGFDSMAVIDNIVFTSRGLTYGLARANGTWHEFEDRNLYLEHLDKERIIPPKLRRFDEFKKSIKTASP